MSTGVLLRPCRTKPVRGPAVQLSFSGSWHLLNIREALSSIKLVITYIRK